MAAEPTAAPEATRKGFFGVFRYSRRALGLVWSTHRPLTVGLAILTVAAGVLPAAMAYVGALIIDAVVNAATVANCDLDVINSIQNGAPDAVALTRAGLVLDTVSYEGDVAAPYTEGSGVGLSDSGSSSQANKGISRFPNGMDTDQNNADFVFSCITLKASLTS